MAANTKDREEKIDILKGIVFVFRHLVPLVGISFIVYIVAKNEFGILKKSLVALGQLTMEIYLLQWYFILDYTGNKWLDSGLSFGIIIFVAWVCGKYISKSKLLGGILFGKA